jgi:hypothetical protein
MRPSATNHSKTRKRPPRTFHERAFVTIALSQQLKLTCDNQSESVFESAQRRGQVKKRLLILFPDESLHFRNTRLGGLNLRFKLSILRYRSFNF